ncbi:MAG: DUF502 domain-containing protein [Acidobacteria bacterium]|nr:DUF502 domain-containing protein [Acidobacteriota bacterium]
MKETGESDWRHVGKPAAVPPPRVLSWWQKLGQHLRRRLLAGLFVIFPVGFTVWILYILFRVLDGFLSPAIDPMIGFHIPGLGLLGVVVLLYLVGLLAANVFGREFLKGFDSLLKRMPVVRAIYVASKQLMDTLRLPGKTAFQRVVLLEYPRRGIWALAFVTGTARRESDQVHLLHLFLPTSPNPTSGMMLILPKTQVQELDMSVEDGVRLVVSGGILSPDSYPLPPDR